MENENWVSIEIKSMRNLIGELGEVIAKHVLSKIYEPCTIYGDTPPEEENKLLRRLWGCMHAFSC